MPQPPSSIQPVCLHIWQPAPSHCQQLMSISALGSVYGKKLGRKRTRDVRREHLAHEREQRALQIRQRDAFADDEPFDLPEHRRVREVEIVAPVDAAGHDDADRRLVRLHVADLHRRGVRAQQRPDDRRGVRFRPCTGVREIQRVLHVARGMLGRHVQRVEAVPLVFDLRAFDDREAHAREDVFHAVAHERQRMAMAERAAGAGQRDVDGCAPRPRARPLATAAAASSSALRSSASARWRSAPMLARSVGRRASRSSSSSARDRRCSCGRDSGRGRPARRAAESRRVSSRSKSLGRRRFWWHGDLDMERQSIVASREVIGSRQSKSDCDRRPR